MTQLHNKEGRKEEADGRQGAGAGRHRAENIKQSTTAMRRTLGKLRERQLSFVCNLTNDGGGVHDEPKGAEDKSGRLNGGQSTGLAGAPVEEHTEQDCWNEMEYSERQNSVRTLELFRYAQRRELVAICAGITLMIYAASWQPISVFILAIMASLMGHYSKQTAWLKQLNSTSPGSSANSSSSTPLPNGAHEAQSNLAVINDSTQSSSGANIFSQSFNFLPSQLESTQRRGHHMNALENFQHSAEGPKLAAYEGYSFLDSLYSFVTPLFDLSSNAEQKQVEEEHIKAAVHDILEHESRQFLRKSFEINGSAFLLALTQLAGFFLGMSLITWAAKKQASRIKLLYFNSSLYQEVTWFEAIDSASGSGSSLNGLVEKYQDGIGMKLALLSYFLGHVGLFALTAFYQMFSLAAFCMPFVLLIGLIIAYLSDWQANSIGQHALFAKRSLQLAEEIIAAIRTVFAFNGQQKEITRYSLSLEPVYRKSLIKHLYTALNTSLSKFSIFACFAFYCFYAKRLFPPYSERASSENKSTILAVMRGAEVSIVNILISIPFLEALQQSKGSIARIFVAIERRSKINAASARGLQLDAMTPPKPAGKQASNDNQADFGGKQAGGTQIARFEANNGAASSPAHQTPAGWSPSISFRMVSFDYADRSGPTRRRSTLPFLNLAGSSSLDGYSYANGSVVTPAPHAPRRRSSSGGSAAAGAQPHAPALGRRRSVIEQIADEAFDVATAAAAVAKPARPPVSGEANQPVARRQSAIIRSILGNEIRELRTGAQRQILNYFNLDIAPGQSVALVGPSGSGKSTVLALVQRLYDVTSGQLLVGQQDIKDLNVAWLRNQIGLVGQEPRLFDMSISENIMLGLSRAESDKLLAGGDDCAAESGEPASQRLMQQVVEAAKAANAHDFIARLPNGYATRVGSGGVQLSGGQKQRIAIARALIRKPKILLLDECTSALDTESEALVHAALKSAGAGRTTLIVAHRLATIQHVDLIVVMSQGQVVACGSHAELMAAAELPTSDINPGAKVYKQLYEEEKSGARTKESRRLSAIGDVEDDGDDSRERQQLAKADEQEGESAGGELSNFDKKTLASGSSGGQADGHDSYDQLNENADGHDQQADFSDSETDTSSELCQGRAGFWKLWQFIEMPKWSSVAAVIVCLLAGLILPLNLIAHSYLFSVFAYSELEQIGAYLHVFGLLILSFSTFVFFVSFLQVILPGYVGEKLSIRLRVKTLEALLEKPMFYFDMDSNSAGALCDRFNGYICNLQTLAGTRVATMLEAVSTLAAGAIFGFGQNLALSSFCLSFALLVLVTTIIESRIVEREASLQQKHDAQLAHLMADALSNIKTIASLNKETYFIRKFSSILRERERGIGLPMVCLHTFLTSLKFVMPAMSWSASMYYGSYLLASERIDLQTIYIVCPVVLFAVNDTFRALVFLPELLKARKSLQRLYKMNREFSPSVLQTLTLAQQLEEQNRLHLQQLVEGAESAPAPTATYGAASGAPADVASDALEVRRASALNLQPAGQPRKKSISFAPTLGVEMGQDVGTSADGPAELAGLQVNRRLSRLQELPSYMRRKSSCMNSLVPRSSARGRIEFRNVEFAYPNRPTALVLDDFTLSVAPGESVALVGTSGSGKSTTVAILEKFYDYHGGHVTLDGRDLRLVEPNWVRSQIGLVQQEPCLLSYTIGDNIRYGDNSRFVSMDEVVEAARTANIHDFIMTLPDQYDTELSSSAYSSCQLSGGQRQRIAIARALIRNAPILIFDEATSALDNKSEQVVEDALAKAKRGRTTLTIAHRLATIKSADKIVVMRDGRVVEWGRHQELIERPAGFYRSLWERQGGLTRGPGSEQPAAERQQQALSTTIIIDGATTNEWATRDEYQRLVEEAQANQQQRQVGLEGSRGSSGGSSGGSSEGNDGSGSGEQSIEQMLRALNQVATVKAAPPHTSRLVLGAPVDSEAETATQDVLSAPDSQTASGLASNELEGALDKLELIERQRAAQVQKLNKLKSLERAAEGDVVKAIAHGKSAAAPSARLLVLESERKPPAAAASSGSSRHLSGAARTISDLVAKGDEGLDDASNLMGRETPRRRCGDELMSLLELYCRGRFYDGEPQVVQPTITKTKRSVDYAEALAADSNGGGGSRRRTLRTLSHTAAGAGPPGHAADGLGLAQSDKENPRTNDGSNNHNQQYLSRGSGKSKLSSRYRGIRGAHKECCERACMVDELKPYCGQV